MRQLILNSLLGFVIFTTGGCSYLFYPHAKDFTEKAKGGTTVETLITLTNMMEATARAGQQGKGKDHALDALHNQLHAFDNTICCVDKNKRALPAHDLLVTHNKELWAVFKRAWKFKDDQPQRSQHLELFATEVRELRESLHALQ